MLLGLGIMYLMVGSALTAAIMFDPIKKKDGDKIEPWLYPFLFFCWPVLVLFLMLGLYQIHKDG